MKKQFHIAGCVMQKDGKYLLVQEKKPSAYGLWNLPAGHVDAGETVEEAAVRETKEETGYTVVIDQPIATYYEPAGKGDEYALHAFLARITDGELEYPEDELLNAEWKTYNEIKKLHEEGKTRTDWIYDSISKVEKGQL